MGIIYSILYNAAYYEDGITNAPAKVYKLSGTSATSVPNYQDLTVDNFYYIVTQATSTPSIYGMYHDLSTDLRPSISSYDPTTGNITLSGTNTYYRYNGDGGAHYQIKADLYGYILCVVTQ